MKIEVNINKKHFYILLTGILLLAGLFSVYAFGGNTPNVAGHSLGEIDFSGTIPNLNVTNLCLSGNCQNSWPEGAVSYWTQDGNTINYNGNVTVNEVELINENNLIDKITPIGGYSTNPSEMYPDVYENIWGVCSCTATVLAHQCYTISCPNTICKKQSASTITLQNAEGSSYNALISNYACYSN